MKHFKFFIPCVLLLLTGCSTETISDRMYTQAIGLTCDGDLSFYAQAFEKDPCEPVTGISISEVIRQEESVTGGKVFIGHTELLCLDGTCTLNPAEELLFQKGLSPACKVLYADPADYFKDPDHTAMIHMIRMSEQSGLLSITDLSTALNEWHGFLGTALLPVQKKGTPGLVLLHKDGACTALSEQAQKGMYWLRRNTGGFVMTLETPDGEQDISVRKIRIEKSLHDQQFYYHIKIWITEKIETQFLETLMQSQCETAIREMLAADADVIGIQDLLESQNLPLEKPALHSFHISVTVQ